MISDEREKINLKRYESLHYSHSLLEDVGEGCTELLLLTGAEDTGSTGLDPRRGQGWRRMGPKAPEQTPAPVAVFTPVSREELQFPVCECN